MGAMNEMTVKDGNERLSIRRWQQCASKDNLSVCHVLYYGIASTDIMPSELF